MIKLKSLGFVLLCVTLISAKGGCSDESTAQPVIGNWIWVKTFCCGRTSTWTSPETCKCKKELQINEDGTFSYTSSVNDVNDKNLGKGKYILRKGLNEYQYSQGDSALCIQFNEQAPAYVEFIGDTLLLSRGYMDYDNVYFIRKTAK